MLSKKPAAEPRQSASGSMAGSTFSVLGPDVAIKGDLTASADLHIDGKVEGDISCAALVQGEASEIIGVVTAESARLAGKIRGSITATSGAGERGSVYLAPQGSAARSLLGNTADAAYGQPVIPGFYLVSYGVDSASGGLPQNTNAPLSCIELVAKE